MSGLSIPIPKALVAKMALKLGRPAKITLTREEVFYCHRGRHPVLMKMRTGVTKDGKLTGMHLQTLLDGGGYGFGLRWRRGEAAVALLRRTHAADGAAVDAGAGDPHEQAAVEACVARGEGLIGGVWVECHARHHRPARSRRWSWRWWPW